MYLEYEFHLDWRSQGEACDAIYQTSWVFVGPKYVLEKVRRSIGDFGMVVNISFGRHANSESNDSLDAIKRTEVMADESDGIHRGEPGGVATSRSVELCSHSPNEFRRTSLCRQHSAQKEK